MTADVPSDPSPPRPSMRHALLVSSLSRYSITIIGLLATFVVARILSPGDFGLFILGAAIFPVAEAVRDLGSIAYVVQEKDLSREKMQTAFTLSLIVTLVMAALILAVSAPLTAFLGAPSLQLFMEVHLIAYLTGPISRPIYALMSRNLAFGRIAVIEQISTLAYAVGSVVLTYFGWGIMGLAWSAALSGVIFMISCLIMQPAFWVFRINLRHWSEILRFGLHGSAAVLVGRLGDAAIYILLGKMLGPYATGILQRAALIALWPERIVLAGLGTVALPAFARLTREGEPLGPRYLHAISVASALNWAALAAVSLLAAPLVDVLLGQAWSQAVPIVHVLALAAVFTFANNLNAVVQTAAGGIERTPLIAAIQYALLLAAVLIGAPFGIMGVAIGGLVIAPFTALVGFLYVRRLVSFTWTAFWQALWPSAWVAACTAIPVAAVVHGGIGSSALLCLAGGVASGVGFMVGTKLVRHPLCEEMQRAAAAIAGRIRSRSSAV